MKQAVVALTPSGIALGALINRGAIDCSANPSYPKADDGDSYFVSVAGKIGGASGISVSQGDLVICTVDGTPAGTQADVGANWNINSSVPVAPGGADFSPFMLMGA